MTEGALGVDVDNPSGASAPLRERRVRRVSLETAYRKPMPRA